jgi:integrase
MGEVVPLTVRKGTAREQLLTLAQHQARVQGKSLAQYLKELHLQVEHTATNPQPVPPRVPREKYTYLTRREVELFFAQITELRDRALFGAMYYFGLRASEVGLLLQEYVNFRTRRIYIPRLKRSLKKSADCSTITLRSSAPAELSSPLQRAKAVEDNALLSTLAFLSISMGPPLRQAGAAAGD